MRKKTYSIRVVTFKKNIFNYILMTEKLVPVYMKKKITNRNELKKIETFFFLKLYKIKFTTQINKYKSNDF